MGYKLSKLLNEKGFNKDYLGSKCLLYATKDISIDEVDWYGDRIVFEYQEGELIDDISGLTNREIQKNSIPAIPLDAALRWLRRDKNYHVEGIPFWDCGVLFWTYKIFDITNDIVLVSKQEDEEKHETYEKAVKAGILSILNNF